MLVRPCAAQTHPKFRPSAATLGNHHGSHRNPDPEERSPEGDARGIVEDEGVMSDVEELISYYDLIVIPAVHMSRVTRPK